jgi:hypothetical protein
VTHPNTSAVKHITYLYSGTCAIQASRRSNSIFLVEGQPLVFRLQGAKQRDQHLPDGLTPSARTRSRNAFHKLQGSPLAAVSA